MRSAARKTPAGWAKADKAEFASIVARLRYRGIRIIPVTGAGVGRNYLLADGMHLTAEGHAFLAARLLPSVVAALRH